jgi:hypothetical protein
MVLHAVGNIVFGFRLQLVAHSPQKDTTPPTLLPLNLRRSPPPRDSCGRASLTWSARLSIFSPLNSAMAFAASSPGPSSTNPKPHYRQLDLVGCNAAGPVRRRFRVPSQCCRTSSMPIAAKMIGKQMLQNGHGMRPRSNPCSPSNCDPCRGPED